MLATDPVASMQWLVRRYLEGFGPATVRDIAQFSTLYRPPARDAVAAMAGSLERLEGPDGEELFDVPDGLLPPEDAPAPPRLMAMWDSTLLAYVDRSRIIPPDYRQLVMRSNGDVLPTLLVDGYVAGVWRPVEGGIEATAFHRLSDDAWDGLETEARALMTIPGRPRTDRLSAICALVGQAPGRRSPHPGPMIFAGQGGRVWIGQPAVPRSARTSAIT